MLTNVYTEFSIRVGCLVSHLDMLFHDYYFQFLQNVKI